eukprot:gene19273-biopygen23476
MTPCAGRRHTDTACTLLTASTLCTAAHCSACTLLNTPAVSGGCEVWTPREKRPRPRPVRVRSFKFYLAPRVRSAFGPRPLPFFPAESPGTCFRRLWPGGVDMAGR